MKIFVFYVCVCLLFRRGWSEVLIKYTDKYVKIYFIIKIKFLGKSAQSAVRRNIRFR